jgi:glutathione S-transferase
MPFSIIVPDAYAYVLGVATSTSLVNLYLSANVALSRKPAGISYPTMYATEEQVAKNPAAYKFNCGMCRRLAGLNATPNSNSPPLP